MKCDKCNVDLDENDVCPQCGCHYIFASEEIRFWDGYKLQKKNKEKHHSSNHRFYEEESLSYEISRDLGELVQRFKKEDIRPGELRGLRWRDVKKDRLELHRSINRYNETTNGKNQNARRCVELSDLARLELEAQLRESGKVTQDTLVFDIPTAKQFELHLARYCKYNNIPVCTPYELRHTFVSIAKVLPAGLVKSLVGHSQDMDTFGVYSHELEGDAQQQASALNSIFSRLLAQG